MNSRTVHAGWRETIACTPIAWVMAAPLQAEVKGSPLRFPAQGPGRLLLPRPPARPYHRGNDTARHSPTGRRHGEESVQDPAGGRRTPHRVQPDYGFAEDTLMPGQKPLHGLFSRLLGVINCLVGHGRVVPKSKLGHPDIMSGLFKPCFSFSNKFRIGHHRAASLL